MDFFFKVILAPTVSILGVIFLAVLLTNSFGKSKMRQACDSFSIESGRETKYVEYTYWDYDCITPQEDGWISTYNLRGK